jgi:hypothetical protein
MLFDQSNTAKSQLKIAHTLTFSMCKFVESWKRANKTFDKFLGYFNFTRRF